MLRRPVRPRVLILAGILATALAVALALPALADEECVGPRGVGLCITPPFGVSPNGQRIFDLYKLISIPAIIIFLGVEILLLIIILRFRRKVPDPLPPQWHGNTVLEIVWTLIPLAVVLFIATLSFLELQMDFTKRTDAETQLEIAIVGYQFNWDYQYPEGFKTTGTLVVPTHKLVRLSTQTRDVIHSWWVPSITGKTDAVPGYQNYTWLNIDRPGKWHGECAELCGAGHYQMQIDVEAKDQADYDAWVAQQKAKASSPSPGTASGARTAQPAGSPSPGAGSAAPSPSPSR